MSWIDELRRILSRLNTERPAAGPSEGVSCREAAERIFEWLDGELEPELERQVGTHLETCARCYPRLLFERAFREAVARVAEGEEAPAALETRILQSLENEGFSET